MGFSLSHLPWVVSNCCSWVTHCRACPTVVICSKARDRASRALPAPVLGCLVRWVMTFLWT